MRQVTGMSRLRKLIVVVAVVISCIGCDRISKAVATDHLADGAGTELLGGIVRLTYAENPGAFLGLGASLGPVVRWIVFVLGAGTVLGGLAWYLLRSDDLRRMQVIGLAMVLGGGLANLADRMAHGFVRDFVQLRLGPLRTGVFNAADLAITTGAVALVLYHVWDAHRRRRAARVR